MVKILILTFNLFAVCLVIFTLQKLVIGQTQRDIEIKNITKDIGQDKLNIISPRLILRYETGSSLQRFVEDSLLPREMGLLSGTEKIAIRICSQEKLLLALPSAAQNPFNLIYLLTTNGGFKPSNIKLLRSEDCISSNTNLYATELWSFEGDSDSIPNVESYYYEQIRMYSFGFDPIKCTNFNYKKATQALIKNMQNDKNSYGLIVKYFLSKPSFSLNKNAEKARKLLSKSGISNFRYKVTSQSWHDGETGCNDKEPNQPMVIFLTVKGGK